MNQRLVENSYRAGAATAVEQADGGVPEERGGGGGHRGAPAQLAALRVLYLAGLFEPAE